MTLIEGLTGHYEERTENVIKRQPCKCESRLVLENDSNTLSLVKCSNNSPNSNLLSLKIFFGFPTLLCCTVTILLMMFYVF